MGCDYSLDKGQIASRVGDFRQVDGPAVLNFIRLNPQLVLSGADSRPSEAALLALVKIALLSTGARKCSDWSMHQAN